MKNLREKIRKEMLHWQRQVNMAAFSQELQAYCSGRAQQCESIILEIDNLALEDKNADMVSRVGDGAARAG